MTAKTQTKSASKIFLQALNGHIQTPAPIWLMRQAGRYLPEYRELRAKTPRFLDFCYTPSTATEAVMQPLRRFSLDAAILFSDILTIPDALGQKVEFIKGEGPVLTPVRNMKDLEALNDEGFQEKLRPVYETVSLIHKTIPTQTALIGFSGSPWTLACYMVEGKGSREFAEPRTLAYTNPEFFSALIDRLTSAVIAYLSNQIEAGAEAIQLFDSWAGVLAEKPFHQWVIEPTAKIVSALKEKYPHIPVIGFPKGSGILYLPYVKETKVTAVSVDHTIPLSWISEALQPICPVQGNLDPLLLVAGGEALNNAVDRILTVLGKGPFVFNLGHGIVPQTPPEHVEQLVKRIRAFKA